MGSSSQFYRDTATASTEGWENTTADPASDGTYWLREMVHPPDWQRVVSELRWVWELHVYGLAGLFSVLAVLCFFTILRLRSQLSARPHLSSLNVFLGILATSRLIVLFVDPYGSKETLPAVMMQVLWDLGYPCLVSAFALLQLSFVQTTQVKMTRLSNETTVSIIITFHFCLIITSGVLGALQHSLRILWLLIQVAFIIWGGFLCLSSLFGCLRLLRTILKVPLRFLTQVDPGNEINSIMPQGMFTTSESQERTLPQPQPKKLEPLHHQPRIRITDENDQTYSYASEGSLAVDNRATEAFPLKCLPNSSPSRWRSSDVKSSSAINEDPAVMRPLIVDGCTRNSLEEETNKQVLLPGVLSAPAAISTLYATAAPEVHRSLSQIPSSHSADEFKFDARKLKRQCRSRLEKQLRRLVFTSVLGISLCLLKAYDVFGPHGLSSGRQRAAVLPWFCFQTISRLVEFSMAYVMVSMSQQSIRSHYYYYPN